jgi:hypothetical protein
MLFPNVRGANLKREKLSLPQDFSGELVIALVAFQQWQQRQVDTWIPLAEQLEQDYIGMSYYELPVIRQMNILSRTFINEGMRAGIPNPKARERTVTLYLDKTDFRAALGMPHEQSIYVLLLTATGKVLWKTEGEFTTDKGEALRTAVEENFN